MKPLKDVAFDKNIKFAINNLYKSPEVTDKAIKLMTYYGFTTYIQLIRYLVTKEYRILNNEEIKDADNTK